MIWDCAKLHNLPPQVFTQYSDPTHMWDRARGARRTNRSSNGFSAKLPVHYKRVRADIAILPSSVSGPSEATVHVLCRVVLNDLSPRGVLLFSAQPLTAGQFVDITLTEPQEFSVKGKVLTCQQIIMDHRIISDAQYPYRIAIDFELESAEDRDRVNSYCELIQENYLKAA